MQPPVRLILIATLLLAFSHAARAQGFTVITTCGTPPSVLRLGTITTGFQDTTGTLCTTAGGGGGGGGGSVTQGTSPWVTSITGTLPAFAATPTVNQGTSPWVTSITGTLPAFAATPTVTLGAGTAAVGSVTSSPASRTIVPLDVATVTTGGTAVTALNAGHATAGGFLVSANAAGICVNQQGTAGTATASGTVCVAANQLYALVPNGNAVSVNSTASTVAIGGEGLN